MELFLDMLLQAPDFSSKALLKIDPLAPLSMVAALPGDYYRSQPAPIKEMLFGLLENVLGWHISSGERNELLKRMEKKLGVKHTNRDTNYHSLLQFHLRFSCGVQPPVQHFNDVWVQHLRGGSFLGGSRNYDNRVIPAMNAYRAKDIEIGDGSEAKGFSKEPSKMLNFVSGDKVHVNVVRPYFPQYYQSPKPREYVIVQGEYIYCIETSPALAAMLREAVEKPSAPAYLGSNDGWVELSWEDLS